MKKKDITLSTAKFAPGEHIRVVPLHNPKPSVSINDLGRQKEDEGGDLFDGKVHAVPANAHLNFNGGPLLTNAQVFTVFWGKLWATTPSSSQMITDLNKFFSTILTRPSDMDL